MGKCRILVKWIFPILLLGIFFNSIVSNSVPTNIEIGSHPFLIITTTKNEFNPVIKIRVFDTNGNIQSEYETSIPYTWDSEYTNGMIAITGGNTLLLLDTTNGLISSVIASSPVEQTYYFNSHVAFTINNGVAKGESEYKSNVCLFKYEGRYDYSEKDYLCAQTNLAPYDIMLLENEILFLGMDFIERKEYLLQFDYDLNLIKQISVPTSGGYFLSSDNDNLILYNVTSYYSIDGGVNYESPSLTEMDTYSFVHKLKNGFLRTNYSQKGGNIYFETINHQKVESKIFLSDDKNRISVINTNDSGVASILTTSSNSQVVNFVNTSNAESLPFSYVIDNDEIVIGAYYLN